MSKEVIGVLIAIIVLGGGYFLYTQSQSSDGDVSKNEVMEKDGNAMGTHEGDAMAMELPKEGDYTIISEVSTLNYSATRIAGTPHVGSVGISEGSLSFSEDGATGSFTIDMPTITETKENDRFLGHINSADFFDVENFPTASFVITNVGVGSNGSMTVTGDLTLVGKTNEIMFTASPIIDESGAEVHADILIDRTRWGINFDSGSIFTDLGDKAIKDEVGISLDLHFIK